MDAVIKYFKPSSISITSKLFIAKFEDLKEEDKNDLTNALEQILEKLYTVHFIPYFSKQQDLIDDLQSKSTEFAVEKLKESLDDESVLNEFSNAIKDLFDHFIIPMNNICSSLKKGGGGGKAKKEVEVDDAKASVAESPNSPVEYGSIIKESKPRHNVRVEAWNAWKSVDGNSTKKYTDENGVEMTAYSYWGKNIWVAEKKEAAPKPAKSAAAESGEKKPRGRPKKMVQEAPVSVAEKAEEGDSSPVDQKASASPSAVKKGAGAAAGAQKKKADGEKAPRAMSSFELFQKENKPYYDSKDKFTDPKTNKEVSGYELSRNIWSDNFRVDSELAKPFNTTAEETKKGIKDKTYTSLAHLDWDSIRSKELKYENGKYTIQLVD